jgi:ATP-dependent RNA helicase DDX3X
MLDMGFEPQVRQIVQTFNMGSKSKHARQSMMFSATFAREVQVMARDFLSDYMFITVGRVGSASELVAQKVLYAEDVEQKKHALDKVLKEYLAADGLAVIFVETKRGADSLEMYLHEKGVAVTAIHGDRTQSEREEALVAFKTGANPVLVATDVAARGLDIPNVSLVVNFDLPKQLDDYVHRIGRTGRAGRHGTAVAFVNAKCQYLQELFDLLSDAKQEIPIWYEDLCKSSRRGADRFGGGGGRAVKTGGVDIRSAEEISASNKSELPRSAPPRAGMAPARDANAFGNTGLEDAW